jgi:hypothetical protein
MAANYDHKSCLTLGAKMNLIWSRVYNIECQEFADRTARREGNGGWGWGDGGGWVV